MSPVDIIIPVHNEEESIGKVLHEMHAMAAQAGIAPRFILCEDGSTDGTLRVLNELASVLPVTVVSGSSRKGYANAIIDGMNASRAETVLFVDGDGQCAPQSIPAMFTAFTGHDMVIGWRNPRSDSPFRLFISAAFKLVYQCAFRLYLKDPSYACVLIRKPALDRIKRQKLGLLTQGFWWEFNARAYALGLNVAEVPVMHRNRISGKTRVYRILKLPRIAYENITSLLQLRMELNQYRKSQHFP